MSVTTSDGTQPAMSYPTVEQYGRWKSRAAELDMSVSEFMQSMIEAGMKVDRGFELRLERDETNRELREQRDELREELDHARQRIRTLEDRVYHSERETIVRFIEEHPGTSYDDIVRHVIDSSPSRVNQRVEELEGEELRIDNGAYYPIEELVGEQ